MNIFAISSVLCVDLTGIKCVSFVKISTTNMMESCFLQFIGNIVMKLHGNNFPFPFWNSKRMQQTCWVLMLKLHLLIFHALSNILNNVLLHSWPKILLSGCSNCLMISWVTKIWSLMDFINNNSPPICYIWNINSIFINKNCILFHMVTNIPILLIMLL